MLILRSFDLRGFLVFKVTYSGPVPQSVQLYEGRLQRAHEEYTSVDLGISE